MEFEQAPKKVSRFMPLWIALIVGLLTQNLFIGLLAASPFWVMMVRQDLRNSKKRRQEDEWSERDDDSGRASEGKVGADSGEPGIHQK